MENVTADRVRARRAQLLPNASADMRVRFLEPFDKALEGSWLVLLCRDDKSKARSWLSGSDMSRIRRVTVKSAGQLDRATLLAETIIARRIKIIWQELALAWGVKLSDENQTEIKETIDHYFVVATFETNAASVADADQILGKITAGAQSFKNGLGYLAVGDNTETASRAVANFVEGLIVEQLSTRPGQKEERSLTQLIFYMDSFIYSCTKARNELNKLPKEASFKDGESWRWLIGRLAEWGAGRGFPIQISKGRQKLKSDRPPSPFVAFIAKLQEIFPPAYRRHTHSEDGLASAMVEARKTYPVLKAGLGA